MWIVDFGFRKVPRRTLDFGMFHVEHSILECWNVPRRTFDVPKPYRFQKPIRFE
jgi:hypothetical protein